ncbi:GDYXXLXY domain-containing protein [Aquabacterium sp. A7-Y]|uniref:GDYXXLXY domain-containing protein n=1 Tax=Aquabacterium sp. A7-Y TaxID=1349605 RepID=UPI00223CD6E7|nr:GDYXXLXY domain-containing protein [Aquabacterium sp. A7-Y]MCW7539681.1 GDYXXLXY domain-containing protein [Aquabacterium sp. A7-Y]
MKGADHLDRTLQAAIAAGVLPATAQRPVQDGRPWPVLLLTALGAWLAALPLLGVAGLVLDDLLREGVGPYVLGVLVLAAAVVALRGQDVPLFVEQLAVPALLVGGGLLGFGLFRDLPDQAAAGALAAVAGALAFLVSHAGLRVLLGAAIGTLTFGACLSPGPGSVLADAWWAWHGSLAVGAVAQALPHAPWKLRERPRYAAVMESLSAGWLLSVLAGLCWWSGTTLLVGASVGGTEVGAVAGAVARSFTSRWQDAAPNAGSVLLALAAAGLGALRWRALRQGTSAGIAAVLLVLAWFVPALGAMLLALAWCATAQRWRLATAAAVGSAWVIGSFYYQLHWSLVDKAAVLVLSAAVLAALAWHAHRSQGDAGLQESAPGPAALPRWRQVGIASTAALVLVVANAGIWQKERLIGQGQALYVDLAPVDPRSLMQGDFMQLNFRLPAVVEARLGGPVSHRRPRVVARRDARGVATLLRLDEGAPLAAGELLIELTPKNGRWVLVSDAWFFKEGEAERWAAARYGEFRVDAHGRALLVGLRGANLERL